MPWNWGRGSSRRMKASLSSLSRLVLVLLLSAPCLVAGADGGKDLPGFLEGNYGLVGRRPGTGETYSGTVTIKARDGGLEVIRCVGGSRHAGQGSIVLVTADRIPALSVRWGDGKKEYRGRYDIHGDADNYARLSGPYVAMEDEREFGWELLYVDPGNGPVCR